MRQRYIVTLTAGSRTVDVAVERKRVKNFSLRITPGCEVRASAPAHASDERIAAFLERNSAWIARNLARAEERRAAAAEAAEALSPDSLIAVWGKPVTVADALTGRFDSPAPRPRQATFASFIGAEGREQATPATTATARNQDASPKAKTSNLPTDPQELARRIQELYRTEVTSVLPGIVRAYEVKMDVKTSRVSIRSMKTRWGSCTPKTGAVRIALELAAYPPECLDSVVAHELVHLMEPSHNARFHQLLDTYCPGNRAASKRLRQPAIPLAAPQP